MQDLSSLTRDWTHAPSSRRAESQPLEYQGSLSNIFLYHLTPAAPCFVPNLVLVWSTFMSSLLIASCRKSHLIPSSVCPIHPSSPDPPSLHENSPTPCHPAGVPLNGHLGVELVESLLVESQMGVMREYVALNSGAETVRSMSTQGGGQCQSLCTSWDSSHTQATCIPATLHVSLWNSIHVSAEKRNCRCRVSFKALTSCRNTEQLGPLHSPCRCFFSGLKVRLCLPKCNLLHGEESD